MDNKLNPEISLIIPVYNVEQYLRKALNSVVNQTFKDLEVIIVNDGSTDSSIDIINEFKEKYPEFIVINQENSSLSEARNAGLRCAKGKYIAFLDSDDFIQPNFLEELYNEAEKNGSDISCCNYTIYYPKSNMKIVPRVIIGDKTLSRDEALKNLITDVKVHHFSWNKLYKKTLFTDNNIKFYKMYFEDISSTPRLFYFANKVTFTSKPLYNYTQRDGSILRTMNANKMNDYILSFGVIRNFLESKQEYYKYKNRMRVYGLRVIFANYYSILVMHLKAYNFKGLLKNYKASTKSTVSFMKSKYIFVEGLPKLPYKIKTPDKKFFKIHK